MGRFSNFQTLLLAFMTLGIIAAGAAIVSFAMMCRYHLHHLQDGGEGGMQICKTVYRPGDNTVAFAMVLRMVLAFVAIATVFVICGVCCCYRLSMAREQNQHLKAVLGHYNLGQDIGKDINFSGCLTKEFKMYLATALNNQLTESTLNLSDKEVKINLISQPEVTSCGSDTKDLKIGLLEDVQLRPEEERDLNMNLLSVNSATQDVSLDEGDVKIDLSDALTSATQGDEHDVKVNIASVSNDVRLNHTSLSEITKDTDIITDVSSSVDSGVGLLMSEELSLPLVHHSCQIHTLTV